MNNDVGYGKVIVVVLICLSTVGILVYMGISLAGVMSHAGKIPPDCVAPVASGLPAAQIPAQCRPYLKQS
ncbi:hypothetical protein LOC54_06105 [Acetobacter sp. AN02]|uniref:hypothetical protein n=1 Tax=Acetobacter sp. AN02 TaxID=2894186 RepID=UPI00243458FD|nr:hypothetical protein [Acetobacter sp. AN02]MDG6094684.1 hypothetical protein [Acetobacter sp. AN02]